MNTLWTFILRLFIISRGHHPSLVLRTYVLCSKLIAKIRRASQVPTRRKQNTQSTAEPGPQTTAPVKRFSAEANHPKAKPTALVKSTWPIRPYPQVINILRWSAGSSKLNNRVLGMVLASSETWEAGGNMTGSRTLGPWSWPSPFLYGCFCSRIGRCLLCSWPSCDRLRWTSTSWCCCSSWPPTLGRRTWEVLERVLGIGGQDVIGV